MSGGRAGGQLGVTGRVSRISGDLATSCPGANGRTARQPSRQMGCLWKPRYQASAGNWWVLSDRP